MKEIDFLDAVGRVDKQYIEECITYKQPKKMNVWIKRMSAIAACFLVVMGAILIINHMNQPVIIDENGFYTDESIGQQSAHPCNLLREERCIITAMHQFQHLIATRLQRNMEMWHETARLRNILNYLICNEVGLN